MGAKVSKGTFVFARLRGGTNVFVPIGSFGVEDVVLIASCFLFRLKSFDALFRHTQRK